MIREFTYSPPLRLVLLCALLFLPLLVAAQQPEEVALRLQSERKNEFRGGVSSAKEAQSNMAKLFAKIMITGLGDGKADQWYSPHLRDIRITMFNRLREVIGIRYWSIPFSNMRYWCSFPAAVVLPAACPVGNCWWHGDRFGPHRPEGSCDGQSAAAYLPLIQDTNFKTCCVRAGEENFTSEQIVDKHRNGDGWAGLFEYYFPVTAAGWENDRTTTMIVEKEKVRTCFAESEAMMHNQDAARWVSGAIGRGRKYAFGAEGNRDSAQAAAGKALPNVQSVIQDVKPEDPRLQMTDSLNNIGLTVRVNLATMVGTYRRTVAERFCMHPRQFDKLMTLGENLPGPGGGRGDPLQLGMGGLTLPQLANIPIWSNYCARGVELMTNPDNSNLLRNIDLTPTDFVKGMTAWRKDPRYCQQLNESKNLNLKRIGFDKAINGSMIPGPTSEEEVGFTCRDGGNLNGGMVPLSIGRHTPVERRTAISDQVYAMLHSARLAKGMHAGQKSFLKGFDTRPYSHLNVSELHTPPFIGKRFAGGGTNELNMPCPPLAGENHLGKPVGDKLYVSDYTHQPFTDAQVRDAGIGEAGVDRYVQKWAKDENSEKEIAKRGLDKDSQNYATSFRFFATCPVGYVRWKPPRGREDEYTRLNTDRFCKEEYFGGVKLP